MVHWKNEKLVKVNYSQTSKIFKLCFDNLRKRCLFKDEELSESNFKSQVRVTVFLRQEIRLVTIGVSHMISSRGLGIGSARSLNISLI